MRKITRQSAQTFIDSGNMSSGNMQVTHAFGTTQMRLHGNVIAERLQVEPENGHVQIRLRDAGWQTNTTKERLNGLLQLFAPGYGIFQRDFAWYLSTPHGDFAWLGVAVFNDAGQFLHQVEAA